jgi:hypothetical protein
VTSEPTTQSDHGSSNDQVICTLYEGHYHFGVAVLINSIVRQGYRGLFWVGHRGQLPPWTAQLSRREDGLFQVGEALLGFELIDTGRHFTHFKPEFMNSIIERGIAQKYLWYFDPDITVRCGWGFYERWVQFGVCLCQEISMGTMPSNHPLRSEWVDLARKMGLGEPALQLERYYNGGFVGLRIEHREFLTVWEATNQLANSAGVDHSQFQTGSRANTFQYADQDAMNIAAMYAKVPLSTVGPEGMGWVTGGFTMYHVLGFQKPWRRKYLRTALDGHPPANGDKHYVFCAEGPIRPYTKWQLRKLRLTIQLASIIGRFYRRTDY